MEREFRGVVSVCREGRVLLRRASGYAHLADRVPNAPGPVGAEVEGSNWFYDGR